MNIIDIIPKWGANYLMVYKNDYRPKQEIIWFGETEIVPGAKIVQIGEKNRTSFSHTHMTYEGTFYIENIKYCTFKGDWMDDDDIIYRYVFAMPDNCHPEFLFISGRKGGYDVDCKKVKLTS